ncbi:MAG: SRPBCC family protein [Opitutaceae bacterium]|nr:SRPBCC family protein [Opitutaceae bacterium]
MPVTHPEQHFRWSWDLAAPPAALWPLVSNTDRFNRDCGYPAVAVVPPERKNDGPVTNTRRLRATVNGITLEWDEHAFEWNAPRRFGVERVFLRGPIARFTMTCELEPRPDGGTHLIYDLRIVPAGLLGRMALPLSIGRQARAVTDRVFRRYDEFALGGLRASRLARAPELVVQNTSVTLAEGAYEVRFQGQAVDRGAYEVGVAAGTTTMLWHGRTGPNAGRTIPCLFQLKGDRLRVCYGLDGAAPSEMATAAGQQRYLATYRRTAP